MKKYQLTDTTGRATAGGAEVDVGPAPGRGACEVGGEVGWAVAEGSIDVVWGAAVF